MATKAKKVKNKSKNPKKKTGGRPRIDYDSKLHPKLALLYFACGGTAEDFAKFLGISKYTLYNWRKKYKRFSNAWNKGKFDPVSKIAGAMYQKALGYSHHEDKIFNDNGKPLIVPTTKHYPPDVAAAKLLMYNWAPDEYKEKQEINLKTEVIEIGKPPEPEALPDES